MGSAEQQYVADAVMRRAMMNFIVEELILFDAEDGYWKRGDGGGARAVMVVFYANPNRRSEARINPAKPTTTALQDQTQQTCNNNKQWHCYC